MSFGIVRAFIQITPSMTTLSSTPDQQQSSTMSPFCFTYFFLFTYFAQDILGINCVSLRNIGGFCLFVFCSKNNCSLLVWFITLHLQRSNQVSSVYATFA